MDLFLGQHTLKRKGIIALKTNKTFLAATAFALAFIAVDVGLFLKSGTSAKGLDAIVTASGEETPTTAITLGSIEDIVTAQGKLEPKDYVDVGAQVSGQIKKLHTDIGSTVKKGDLIAEIDPLVYQSRVAGGAAQLKTLAGQKAEIEATIKQAQQKLARNQKLIASNAISRETVEDSQTDLDIASAKLKSIKAQIEEAQSTLEGDQVNLSYTKIYAPMDGTVVDRAIKEGQTINASQTAPIIVQVANLDTMTVRAQVAEADVSRLRNDMPVYFTTLGATGRRWNGQIRQILPTPESVNDVVLYNVLIDVDNTDHSLMTGMTTQNFFIVAKAENIPIIPVSALGKRMTAQDNETGTAYEVDAVRGGKIETVVIHVGLMDRKTAEVKSGLIEGDRVVIPQPIKSTKSNAAATGGAGRVMGPRL